MKNLIIFIAIVMIGILLLGTINNGEIFKDPNNTDVVSTAEGSSTGTQSTATKYYYTIDCYDSKTNKFLVRFELTSTKNIANMSVNSNNEIILSAADGASTGWDTDNMSNITLSKTVFTPNDHKVYITYTETSSTTHVHTYTVTTEATCSTEGVKTCECGATLPIAKLEHSFTDSTGCGSGAYYSCMLCGAMSDIPVPHAGDNDGDGSCDFCGESV